MSILILMATYNGAGFLREQIESIRCQTHADWRLLIRDDGSFDGTPELLRALAREDSRIELLRDHRGRLGVLANFSLLIDMAAAQGAEYVALADQDDHWQPDKLALQTKAMARLEASTGNAVPCLIHCDLEVVDQHMRRISPSFVRYQGLRRPDRAPLSTCLVQNHVVGCTILANRALLTRAAPIPNGIHMHDWWLSVCAHALGTTRFIPLSLVRYRQHDQNRVGARGVRGLLAKPRRWPLWLGKMGCLYRAGFYQARMLRARWPVEPAPDLDDRRARLDGFLSQDRRSGLGRLGYLLRHRIRAQHPSLTLLFYLQSLLLSPGGHEQRAAFDLGCRERAGATRRT